MAKPSQASKTTTATAQAPAPKTATALATEPKATPAPAPAADKPPVALVPDAPPQPKRRGRPPGGAAKEAKKPRKAKSARPEVLFLVETGEESGQFETQSLSNVTDLLDLLDENRKVLATREWREF